VQDTELLRVVWKSTRPLDGEEWQEYWVSERINDRGMLADLDVCRGAVQYRVEESEYIKAECVRLTGGAIVSPTLTAQINTWLWDQLPDDLRLHMVKETDIATGAVTKTTANKQVLARLLEDIYVSDTPPEDNVVELIEMLQFGRSSSAIKFEKILNQEVDGRLTGSYVAQRRRPDRQSLIPRRSDSQLGPRYAAHKKGADARARRRSTWSRRAFRSRNCASCR
jgi:hypothetical protein